MIIILLFFTLSFLGFIIVIGGWKFFNQKKKILILRISYFIAFLGIISSFLKVGFYSENIITAFALLIISFIISEIYNKITIKSKGEKND